MANALKSIGLQFILPNPEQPRKYFDAVELADLAQSIRENGVIQPIVVEEAKGGMYIIHDGERRFRAAKLAELSEIPAIVTPGLNGTGPEERLQRALIANIQRSDLGPIEEARALNRLHEMGLSENRIAIRLGISIARVHLRLRLLLLEEPIQDLVDRGKLSKDGRLVEALLGIPNSAARQMLAKKLAEHHTTINAGVEAAKKVTQQLRTETIVTGIPAMRMAVKRGGEVKRPVWDAMAQVGKVPPWLMVEISARDTCDACSLRDLASEVTCRECPLVTMLAKMIGKAQ